MSFNDVRVSNSEAYEKQWLIKSFTDPEKSYKVSLRTDGRYECSCPVWIYRRRECKHIEAIKAAREDVETEFLIEEVQIHTRWEL